MVRQRCRNDRTRFDTKGNYVTLFGVLCITTVITYTQAQKSHGFDGVRFISPPFSLDRVSRRFSLPANYFSLIGRVRRFVARKLKLIVSWKRSRERINYTPSSARAGSPRRRNETIWNEFIRAPNNRGERGWLAGSSRSRVSRLSILSANSRKLSYVKRWNFSSIYISRGSVSCDTHTLSQELGSRWLAFVRAMYD